MSECAVCYNDCARPCRLTCGHAFCHDCVREWYTKGSGTGCPMCRRPMYFRGLRAMRDRWDKTAWREKADAYFAEAFDLIIETNEGLMRCFVMDDLRDLESTYQVLIQDEATLEEIEYIMYEPEDYYFSIRRFGRDEKWPEPDPAEYPDPIGRPVHDDVRWWEMI